jgi:sec-independent protein translocase protein TatB
VLNFSPEKVLLLMVIALVVLGPNRLPGAAKSVGRMIGQLRQMTGGLQSEVASALAEPKDALMSTVKDLGLHELRDSVRSMNPLAPITSPSAPSTTTGPTAISGAVGAPSASPTGGGDLPPPPDDPSLN